MVRQQRASQNIFNLFAILTAWGILDFICESVELLATCIFSSLDNDINHIYAAHYT